MSGQRLSVRYEEVFRGYGGESTGESEKLLNTTCHRAKLKLCYSVDAEDCAADL